MFTLYRCPTDSDWIKRAAKEEGQGVYLAPASVGIMIDILPRIGSLDINVYWCEVPQYGIYFQAKINVVSCRHGHGCRICLRSGVIWELLNLPWYFYYYYLRYI